MENIDVNDELSKLLSLEIDFEEMKVNEHPDFVPGPRGDLFYLDYFYGGTQSL